MTWKKYLYKNWYTFYIYLLFNNHVSLAKLAVPRALGKPNKCSLLPPSSQSHPTQERSYHPSQIDRTSFHLKISQKLYISHNQVHNYIQFLYLGLLSPTYQLLVPILEVRFFPFLSFNQGPQTKFGIFRRLSAKGCLDHHRFREPPAYTAQLLILHQHRANNQYRRR